MGITLVVLAAGIGSRYGAGIKQLARVGPSGEIIMDYSVHDAVEAGFDRVVFIIRRDIYNDFREVAGDRLERMLRARGVKWDYAFQELGDAPQGRTKPWGTGQAVLCCKDLLDGPFAVINADDYYGKSAYKAAYDFLAAGDPRQPYRFAVTGFVLKNTLSEAGEVTRGLCTVDSSGRLTDIKETRHIVKTPDGAAVNGPDGLRPLDGDGQVSMNMWMLTPAFVEKLEDGFGRFKATMKDPLKDEYLLPDIVGRMVQSGLASVQVLPSRDRWFGITHHDDRDMVEAAFRALVEQGVYPRDLFAGI